MQRLRVLAAIPVFLSGYALMGPMLFVLGFDWKHWRADSPFVLLGIQALFLLSTRFTACHLKHSYSDGFPAVVLEYEDCSADVTNYAIPYIAGFALSDPSNIGQLLAIAIVLVAVFQLNYFTQSPVVNPFLLSLKYRVYSAKIKYRGGDKQTVTIVSRSRPEVGKDERFQKIFPGYLIQTPNQDTNEPGTEGSAKGPEAAPNR